jgi:hypothetical protein
MAAQPDVREKERDLIARCVAEAYETLDLIPGVNPNGPALVWLARTVPAASSGHTGRLTPPRPTADRTERPRVDDWRGAVARQLLA